MQKTEQETFWAGSFGNEYTVRNQRDHLVPSNTALFANILARTRGVRSVIEFGSNVGLNLKAIHNLLPRAELSAIEINEHAVAHLNNWGKAKVYHQSMLDFVPDYQRDLVFIKGVL